MRVSNTDIGSILNADLVPDEIYTFKIIKVKDQQPPEDHDPSVEFEPAWSNAMCQIEAADDPALNTEEFIGRRLTLWLLSTGRFPRRGLNSLIKHKCVYAPGEGWEEGLPKDEAGNQDTSNLEGVTFKGKVRRYKKKNNEWEQEIRPLTY